MSRTYSTCKGTNCGCTDGLSHSPECRAEHDEACGITLDPSLIARNSQLALLNKALVDAEYIARHYRKLAGEHEQEERRLRKVIASLEQPDPLPPATPSGF